MSKKKLTNKEIAKAIDGLSNNDLYLHDKILQLDKIFGLYLEHRKETDKFDKFVKGKVEEFEKQQRSKIKKGA